MTIASTYPLGLWRAWSYVHFPVAAWIYPRPETAPPPLPMMGSGAGEGHALAAGTDEFSGLRRYEPGDTPRQIAWKALARGAGLHSKEFAGSTRGQCRLDWNALPSHLDTEARLSRLTGWILVAERAKIDYVLSIPGLVTPLTHGAAHRLLCLRALAGHPFDRR